MKELNLDFYGIPVRLVSDAETVLEFLRRDFEYFAAPPTGNVAPADSAGGAPITLTLHAKQSPPRIIPRSIALFRTSEFTAYDSGKTRFVKYRDGALAIYDFSSRNGRIYCRDMERLHELAYLALLSRVGEDLDLRGIHRIHALGFELAGKAGLILLPTGGGKSLLALELLRFSRMGIVSEDTPLISRQTRSLAFPLRWGFQSPEDITGIPPHLTRTFRRRRYGPKWLVDIGFFRHRIKTGLPVRWLLIGKRKKGRGPEIKPISRAKALWWLAIHLVIGKGVAQMAEYMLRPYPEAIWKLIRIAFSRMGTALRILKATRPRLFLLGSDPKVNAKFLSAFLDECVDGEE